MNFFKNVRNTYDIFNDELGKKNRIMPYEMASVEIMEYEYFAITLNNLALRINSAPKLLRPFYFIAYKNHQKIEKEIVEFIRFWSFVRKDKRIGRLVMHKGNC